MLTALPGWVWPILAIAISSLGAAFSIGYARRHSLIDLPGRRRSHWLPTPRGGGIGIVVAALVSFCLPICGAGDLVVAIAFTGALLFVAAIGWWDDHHPLGALSRLIVHGVAATCVVLALCWQTNVPRSTGVPLLAIFAALMVVWSINLHNFMDGINGLLAVQAAFVFVVLGAADVSANQWSIAWAEWSLAAACLGFLPFNFPHARVFMGDVGSGSLGLLIAMVIGLGSVGSWPARLWVGLALGSSFFVDATCTLLLRLVRGRRWYSAHREHLYQWLVRSGYSHVQVVGRYMAWNLLVALPAATFAMRRPDIAPLIALGVAALGMAVWSIAKVACLQGAQRE